jgi:hypothetical protein
LLDGRTLAREREILAALMLGPGVVILAMSSIMFAGCGGSEKNLTSRGDGTADTIEVSYRVSEGDTVTETEQPPWELDVEVEGDWSVDLTVKNPETSGHVTCGFEGDAIDRTIGTEGEASAHCSATRSGNTTAFEAEGEEFSSAAVRGTGPAQSP